MNAYNIGLNTPLGDVPTVPLYGHYIKNTSHKVYRKLIALGYKPLGGNFQYNLTAKHYLINIIGEILYDGVAIDMMKCRLTKGNNIKLCVGG